jgi:hypothetical protein
MNFELFSFHRRVSSSHWISSRSSFWHSCAHASKIWSTWMRVLIFLNQPCEVPMTRILQTKTRHDAYVRLWHEKNLTLEFKVSSNEHQLCEKSNCFDYHINWIFHWLTDNRDTCRLTLIVRVRNKEGTLNCIVPLSSFTFDTHAVCRSFDRRWYFG